MKSRCNVRNKLPRKLEEPLYNYQLDNFFFQLDNFFIKKNYQIYVHTYVIIYNQTKHLRTSLREIRSTNN